jgi:AraC-like DNA-binding protein
MSQPSTPILMPQYQWNLLHTSLEWIEQCGPLKKEVSDKGSVGYYSAIWVRKGCVRKSIGTKVVEAEAGEWIFAQPGKMNVFECTVGTQYMRIGFNVRWSGEGRLLLPNKQWIWKTGALPELEEVSLRLHREANQRVARSDNRTDHRARSFPSDISTHFWLRHLFDEWFMVWERILRQSGKGWAHVRKIDTKVALAAHHLETRFMDETVDIAGMAKSLGISANHLTYLFHQEYGMSPNSYRMKLRLSKAIQELQTTRDEIKEIADRLGCTPTWFGVWIKRETGMTPKQHRHAARLR